MSHLSMSAYEDVLRVCLSCYLFIWLSCYHAIWLTVVLLVGPDCIIYHQLGVYLDSLGCPGWVSENHRFLLMFRKPLLSHFGGLGIPNWSLKASKIIPETVSGITLDSEPLPEGPKVRFAQYLLGFRHIHWSLKASIFGSILEAKVHQNH